MSSSAIGKYEQADEPQRLPVEGHSFRPGGRGSAWGFRSGRERGPARTVATARGGHAGTRSAGAQSPRSVHRTCCGTSLPARTCDSRCAAPGGTHRADVPCAHPLPITSLPSGFPRKSSLPGLFLLPQPCFPPASRVPLLGAFPFPALPMRA